MNGFSKSCLALTIMLLFSICVQINFAQDYTIPFYAGGTYDESIPTPESVLGISVGERPLRYNEAAAYFKLLAESSPIVKFYESGSTYQGRKLIYLIITSEENWKNIEQIKTNISVLSDPRKSRDENQVNNIIESSPAVALMMYSIHGDEVSGADASVQLAYQLTAGTDDKTRQLRNELVIGIYPMENPDGRERFLSQMEQWSGKTPNSDVQSMPHRGLWPSGRTNHYHFDLNRDWFILSQPESIARVNLVKEWKPQLVIDAHEMGAFDTYLFNPPREPINPNMDLRIRNWWNIFAADQANAFNKYGWSYYTKDWLEEWYPGYGSSYPSYHGAVSILYEQAGTDGSLVKRPDGTILTYRESVHHQFVSSLANLGTAAKNRKSLLQDFYKIKKEAVEQTGKYNAFIIDPTSNPSRAEKFIDVLLMHGIEVSVSNENFTINNAESYWNQKPQEKSFNTGTYIINLSQPLKPLIKAILEFDPRMNNEYVQRERESLEKGEGTQLYEVSAWSMLMAYGLDAYRTSKFPSVNISDAADLPAKTGMLINPNPAYGYLFSYDNDSAIDALLKFFELGYQMRVARKPFTIENVKYDRGAVLIRLHENPNLVAEVINAVAESSKITIRGVNTALCQEGPDLGTGEFVLLTPPKIAMLTGPSISMGSFGSLWYLLDQELGIRFSIINSSDFTRVDLRKYNVLILPSAWGAASYKNVFEGDGLTKLKDWISDGGTLIGVGGAAAFLADSSSGLSNVKLRRQVLKDIKSYQNALQKEELSKVIAVDSLELWENKQTENVESTTNADTENEFKNLIEQDERYRIFYPNGVIMKLNLDEEHWLNFGAGDKIPAIYFSSYAYLSKSPVQTAARFSNKSDLRLSGLLWPEAKIRWENSAYATRESFGKGQIILFAGEPNFRSYFYATIKLFVNSILLGPGMGTQQSVQW